MEDDCSRVPEPCPETAALLHARRFTRFLVLSRDLPRTSGACSWCGGPKSPAVKYCCAECRNEAFVRSSGRQVHHLLMRRDRGVCSECGLDTHGLKSACYAIYRTLRQFSSDTRRTCAVPRWVIDQWGPFWSMFTSASSMWQADHIVPVSEGGGVCGLDNYRTLCLKCHKKVTRELAGRRARQPGKNKKERIPECT